MINKLSILFLLGATALGAQNTIKATKIGGSILIERVESPQNILGYDVILQNSDDLTKSTYFWSETGAGLFPLPYCNTRVTTTAIRWDLSAMTGNFVIIQRYEISVKVWSLPGRKVGIDVKGGDFEISFHYIGTGRAYMFYAGMRQHYPSARFQEGSYVLFLPYIQQGLQYAVIRFYNPCGGVVSRIFYLS